MIALDEWDRDWLRDNATADPAMARYAHEHGILTADERDRALEVWTLREHRGKIDRLVRDTVSETLTVGEALLVLDRRAR